MGLSLNLRATGHQRQLEEAWIGVVWKCVQGYFFTNVLLGEA